MQLTIPSPSRLCFCLHTSPAAERCWGAWACRKTNKQEQEKLHRQLRGQNSWDGEMENAFLSGPFLHLHLNYTTCKPTVNQVNHECGASAFYIHVTPNYYTLSHFSCAFRVFAPRVVKEDHDGTGRVHSCTDGITSCTMLARQSAINYKQREREKGEKKKEQGEGEGKSGWEPKHAIPFRGRRNTTGAESVDASSRDGSTTIVPASTGQHLSYWACRQPFKSSQTFPFLSLRPSLYCPFLLFRTIVLIVLEEE